MQFTGLSGEWIHKMNQPIPEPKRIKRITNSAGPPINQDPEAWKRVEDLVHELFPNYNQPEL